MNILLGRVVGTPAALEVQATAAADVLDLLARHARGDWGHLGDNEKRLNGRALKDGSRFLSAYKVADGVMVDYHRGGSVGDASVAAGQVLDRVDSNSPHPNNIRILAVAFDELVD